jgi:hypothetical protein
LIFFPVENMEGGREKGENVREKGTKRKKEER